MKCLGVELDEFEGRLAFSGSFTISVRAEPRRRGVVAEAGWYRAQLKWPLGSRDRTTIGAWGRTPEGAAINLRRRVRRLQADLADLLGDAAE